MDNYSLVRVFCGPDSEEEFSLNRSASKSEILMTTAIESTNDVRWDLSVLYSDIADPLIGH